jgi:hypothetical protein
METTWHGITAIDNLSDSGVHVRNLCQYLLFNRKYFVESMQSMRNWQDLQLLPSDIINNIVLFQENPPILSLKEHNAFVSKISITEETNHTYPLIEENDSFTHYYSSEIIFSSKHTSNYYICATWAQYIYRVFRRFSFMSLLNQMQICMPAQSGSI